MDTQTDLHWHFLRQMESLAWVESYTLTASGLPITAWHCAQGVLLHTCDQGRMEALCPFDTLLQSSPLACGEKIAFFAENPAQQNDLQLYLFDRESGQLFSPPLAATSRKRSLAWLDQRYLLTVQVMPEGANLVLIDSENEQEPRILLPLPGKERWIDPLPVVGPEGQVLFTIRAEGVQHLLLLDWRRGTQRILLRGNKSARPITGCWSPDGKQLICFVQRARTFEALLLDVPSGKMCRLDVPALREVPQWRPDGRQILLTVDSWPAPTLWLYDLQTRQMSAFPVPEGLVASAPCWQDDRCYFIASAPAEPPALWCWETSPNRLRRMTPHYDLPPLSWPEVLLLPTPLAFALPCLFFKPQGERKPKGTVLALHGGPSGYWQIGWDPVTLALVLAGYQVMLVNTRGSTLHAYPLPPVEPGKYGQTEVEDIGFCLEALQRQGLADPAAMILLGYSHGAFVAYRATVQYERSFRAAILASGYLRPQDLLQSRDPEAHALFSFGFAAQEEAHPAETKLPVHCPLLIIHGAHDPQIPLQAMQASYQQLTGAAHELLLLPGEGHAYRGRRNIILWISTALKFIDGFIMEEGFSQCKQSTM